VQKLGFKGVHKLAFRVYKSKSIKCAKARFSGVH
jgi:hypothetical protein